MLRQLIYTQWKWSRLELGLYAVIGLVIPAIIMKIIASSAGAGGGIVPISTLLQASYGAGSALATLAFVCAVSAAVRPWITDHARAHVFALSLPVRWSEFVRLRFIAGAVLLVIPAVAVWFGGILAGFALPLPATLHAYPTSIALRFYASTLVLYGAAFALQYLAGRRAAKVAALALIAWVAIELVGQWFGLGSFSQAAWAVVTSWPGPFEVVTARWMLIDV